MVPAFCLLSSIYLFQVSWTQIPLNLYDLQHSSNPVFYYADSALWCFLDVNHISTDKKCVRYARAETLTELKFQYMLEAVHESKENKVSCLAWQPPPPPPPSRDTVSHCYCQYTMYMPTLSAQGLFISNRTSTHQIWLQKYYRTYRIYKHLTKFLNHHHVLDLEHHSIFSQDTTVQIFLFFLHVCLQQATRWNKILLLCTHKMKELATLCFVLTILLLTSPCCKKIKLYLGLIVSETTTQSKHLFYP